MMKHKNVFRMYCRDGGPNYYEWNEWKEMKGIVKCQACGAYDYLDNDTIRLEHEHDDYICFNCVPATSEE